MPFDPFATDLDLEAARAVLAEALSGADDGELFLERRRGESLMFDDGRLKNASYDSGEGFGCLLYTSPSPRDRG